MNPSPGTERPSAHEPADEDRAAKYLVVIDSAGGSVARLFLADREVVAEFDGAAEEVAMMTRELLAERGASGPEWNRALSGHSPAERSAALVFTLDA
jgi:hypothetical protein